MPDLLESTVAKKKTKSVPDGRKPMVVQIRGSEEFKAWIEELADLERDTVAKFVERVVRKHAESIGFREMPDR
jgi:uncharacterized protein (DUF1778 family)